MIKAGNVTQMVLGQTGRYAYSLIVTAMLALMLLFASNAQAQDDAAPADAAATEAPAGYTPMAPTEGKGMPVDGRLGFQDQFTADGRDALWMHDYLLLPIITVISLFVLALLLWVIVRYNRRANPVPSKTTHNTAIEVIWTVVPALILVVIAVPSINLLLSQYETPPEEAITVKATGYQWYWGYTYPDNGGFEVISNMLPPEEALDRGEPNQLAVDNRMVVPANTPIRLQTTAADVIHSFGVASLWFKMDAVPGRLNERLLTIEEPGVYYGQCYELCGARHGFMPVVVEALPRDEWEAWVLEQGGTVGEPEVAEANTEEGAEEAPAA
ncbi:MAG: cytochrome c oxidase subunit II [Altererythrobacter sp.]|nr:cytochrome c oxidase subunit II [Altererythrobacter sp.]MBO6641033.1 cytochrome c oxidase subunit II [Altererythrobacter sp.]MBO6708269.1 cytochrome c oxidase subunit II [Altererythrobacter sp.]MBO6945595.1 cytochrome c oxidase subunit II [Altererythrobacter sp.]